MEVSTGEDTAQPQVDRAKAKTEEQTKTKAAGTRTKVEEQTKTKVEEQTKTKTEEQTKTKADGDSIQGNTKDHQKPRSPHRRRRGRYDARPERSYHRKQPESSWKPDDKPGGQTGGAQHESVSVRAKPDRGQRGETGGAQHESVSVRAKPDRGVRGQTDGVQHESESVRAKPDRGQRGHGDRRGQRSGFPGKGRPGSTAQGVGDSVESTVDLKGVDQSDARRRDYHDYHGRYSGYDRDRQEGRQNYKYKPKAKINGDDGKLKSLHDTKHRQADKPTEHTKRNLDSKHDLMGEDIGSHNDVMNGSKDVSHQRGARKQYYDRDRGASAREFKGQSRGVTKPQKSDGRNWKDREKVKTATPERDKSTQKLPMECDEHIRTKTKEECGGSDSQSKGSEPIKKDTVPLSDKLALTHAKKKPQHSPQQHRFKAKSNERFIPTVQSDELSERLTAGKYECTVCCEVVRAHEQVWNCTSCYLVFHLKCIKKWATAQVANMEEDVSPTEGWRCPCCRNLSTIIPTVYKCYCGKVTNPRRHSKSELTVPHSCGGICLKKLANTPESACKHKCRLPCHPGPCPPCPVMVKRSCPCGRKSYQVRCSKSSDLPSCGVTCGRELNCKRHSCEELCHPGACSQCSAVLAQHCYCGRANRDVCCGEATGVSYSCDKICNRELDCGNHLCELPCHKGVCPSCALLPAHVIFCPCGATPLSELLGEAELRVSCLDPVPTCNTTCARLLPCSTADIPHTCSSMCHHGDCPPCDKSSLVWCNCGRTSSTLACVMVVRGEGGARVELKCQDICNKKKSCKRHRCNVRCCIDAEHICELVCGKRLQCGQHYCQEPCHVGHCRQCWEYSYEELHCHCGAEVLYPPIPCGAHPPPCFRPCARIHSCSHPVSHTCHPDSEDCPPCTFLTEKICMGGHETRRNIPCHISDISCGNPCGKALPCGMHKCQKICHKGECFANEDTCKQPCKEKRKHCEHECAAPCHPGLPCQDTPCRAEIFVPCKCGRKREKTLCLACGSGAMHLAFQNFKLLSSDLGSKLSDLQSGQTVKISSVTLQQTPGRVRHIDCDEVCAQEERNRKLAAALEIDHAIISPLEPNETQYSPFLLEEARNDLSFVASVEKELKALVEGSQGASGVSRSYSFRPMKSTQRRTIHELSVHYGCDTISYDPEPIRNVIVSVKKSRAKLPALSLTKTVERERSRPPPPPVSVMAVSGSEKTHENVLYHNTSPVKDYFADDLEL